MQLGQEHDDEAEGEPDLKRFAVELFVVHPTIDPDDITGALGLTPTHERRIGEQAVTPNGTILAHVHPDTRWRYGRQYATPEQFFAYAIAEFLDVLEPHAAFFRSLRTVGGRANLIVEFLGDGYFGDSIPLDVLARIVALELDLAFEIFMVPQTTRQDATASDEPNL